IQHYKMASFTAKFHYKQNGDVANFDKVFTKSEKHPFYVHSPAFFCEQDPRTKFCMVLQLSHTSSDPQFWVGYLQFASEMFYGESSYIPTQDIAISASISFYIPSSRNGVSIKRQGKSVILIKGSFTNYVIYRNIQAKV